jgi:hypothetical protein
MMLKNERRRGAMRTNNFRDAYGRVTYSFKNFAKLVPANTWQGVDVHSKPEMATRELEDYYFSFILGTEELDYYRIQIGPNLPWADRHFELDRVSGEPLNPGYTWMEWPYSHSANNFRKRFHPGGEEQFNHSYAERYWPKYAGRTENGQLHLSGLVTGGSDVLSALASPHSGIRYKYGDLADVVGLLVKNPLTRNAYLPVWFPEDTGVVHGGRTPCSIGYLFRMRENKLSVFYDIRSCDFVRHFQDDVYLTIRLLLWVLKECRKRDDHWNEVTPGDFTMHIGSFHIFANDWQKVMG